MTSKTSTGAPGHAPGASGRHTQGVLIDVPPIVRGRPLVTRGTAEIAVMCPRCKKLHRHRNPGIRRAPCGATYLVHLGRKQVHA